MLVGRSSGCARCASPTCGRWPRGSTTATAAGSRPADPSARGRERRARGSDVRTSGGASADVAISLIDGSRIEVAARRSRSSDVERARASWSARALAPRLAGEAKSYAERLFKFPRIRELNSDEASRARAEPARERGIEIEAPDAIASPVVEFTQGYPYFIQELRERRLGHRGRILRSRSRTWRQRERPSRRSWTRASSACAPSGRRSSSWITCGRWPSSAISPRRPSRLPSCSAALREARADPVTADREGSALHAGLRQGSVRRSRSSTVYATLATHGGAAMSVDTAARILDAACDLIAQDGIDEVRIARWRIAPAPPPRSSTTTSRPARSCSSRPSSTPSSGPGTTASATRIAGPPRRTAAEGLAAAIRESLPFPASEREWVLWVELWLRAVREPDLRPVAARLCDDATRRWSSTAGLIHAGPVESGEFEVAG